MLNLFKLNNFINNLLETPSYPDQSQNGLQVESANIEIKKIALAVDSGLSVIKEATEKNADLLIVHHGILWGDSPAITGAFAKKIDLLLDSGCSLIAQHLPLDGNPEVGNNYELARLFSLQNISGFWEHGKGKFIGAKGELSKPVDIDYFLEKAQSLDGFGYNLKLEFGKQKIKTCAIVSGGGSGRAELAHKENIDLFIAGEPKQASFHNARDLEQSMLFLGHYATETVGVKALGRRIEKEFELETFFIDQPTGI